MEKHIGSFEIRIQLHGDLNLVAVQSLDGLLQSQPVYPERLILNLSQARYVNTIGIRFLHGLILAGIKVRLEQAPPLLAETLRHLSLEDYLLPLLD